MTRLPHITALCLLFSSMWLHGGVLSSDMSMMDMDSMGATCLEHCLDAVHVDTIDHGQTNTVIEISPSVELVTTIIQVDSWSPHIESHHDPGQILTTIKRE
jgi:hypothetical protein